MHEGFLLKLFLVLHWIAYLAAERGFARPYPTEAEYKQRLETVATKFKDEVLSGTTKAMFRPTDITLKDIKTIDLPKGKGRMKLGNLGLNAREKDEFISRVSEITLSMRSKQSEEDEKKSQQRAEVEMKKEVSDSEKRLRDPNFVPIDYSNPPSICQLVADKFEADQEAHGNEAIEMMEDFHKCVEDLLSQGGELNEEMDDSFEHHLAYFGKFSELWNTIGYLAGPYPNCDSQDCEFANGEKFTHQEALEGTEWGHAWKQDHQNAIAQYQRETKEFNKELKSLEAYTGYDAGTLPTKTVNPETKEVTYSSEYLNMLKPVLFKQKRRKSG